MKIFLSPNSPAGWAVAAAVCAHKRACYSPRGAGVLPGRSVSVRDSTVRRVGRFSARLGLFYDLGREAAHGASRLRSRLFRTVLRIETFLYTALPRVGVLDRMALMWRTSHRGGWWLVFTDMCILVLTEHQLFYPSEKFGIVRDWSLRETKTR